MLGDGKITGNPSDSRDLTGTRQNTQLTAAFRSWFPIQKWRWSPCGRSGRNVHQWGRVQSEFWASHV